MTNKEILILLNMVPDFGYVRLMALLELFGDVTALLKAKKEELQKAGGIGSVIATNIYNSLRRYDILEKELKLIEKNGLKVITVLDDDYPRSLKHIYTPPILLYIKGNPVLEDMPNIAIVGSRRSSLYGIKVAETFSYALAGAGACIVSGLARGIDTCAHRGAVKAHGKSIAVFGNGFSNIYPSENKELIDKILENNGSLISEFPIETPPLPENFPRRNRIISGLSKGVVVVEAGRNSGALITADFALQQGKEIFAIPGRIDSPSSFGTNQLIKQGARLVQEPSEVLDGLNLSLRLQTEQPQRESCKALVLSDEERCVYENLGEEPKYLDEIVRDSKLSVQAVSGLLVRLQLKRLVKEYPGKRFVKI